MIEEKNNPILETVNLIFNTYKDSYVLSNLKITISHLGLFSQDFVNGLVDGNENLMTSFGDSKTTKKRVFSILIEGLQNVRKHAAKDFNNRQEAFLIISKNELIYKINFGNLILTRDNELVKKKVDYINSLSSEELKKYYLKELSENVFSEKNGAGLGFIIMKMKSDNLLNFTIKEVDSTYSFLSIEVDVRRD